MKSHPFAHLLTVKEACSQTKLEAWEIYSAGRSGALRCFRPSGSKRMMFFTKADLTKFMKALAKMEKQYAER